MSAITEQLIHDEVMYSYIMKRTQISLTAAQKRRLDEESEKTGRSMSALVREAIDEKYGVDWDPEAAKAALEQAFGLWEDRDFTGQEYVEQIRTGRRLTEIIDAMNR